MNNEQSSNVCKTVRSLGFSAKRAACCAKYAEKQIQSMGPEAFLGRLKDLESYYTDPDNASFPRWMSKKRRPDGLYRPKGDLGQLVGTNTKRETVITILGSVRTSIVLKEPTKKQLDKFVTAVANPPIPANVDFDPCGLEKDAHWFEHRLKKKWQNREFFGPGDVDGTRIPYGSKSLSIRYKNDSKTGCRTPVRNPAHVMRAWDLSITLAPACCWSFLDSIQYTIPDTRPEQSRVVYNKRRKQAFDSGKRHPTVGKKSRTKVLESKTLPIGHISFLQKPAGKLRTVANPNRLAQWEVEPLGEVLSDWVNSQPGVYVLDQEAGIEKVQSWLKDGEVLVSADLSSASDTLDYRRVLGPLFRQPQNSLTRKSLEFFDRLSKMPWYLSSDVARQKLGKETISWKQGQPLGLRPSFPILTITNLTAAQNAVLHVDGEISEDVPFVIVGDDIVIKQKYAEKYAEIIGSIGGIANIDKSMVSDKQAEFCSRLITPEKVIRLKPRWLEDDPIQNILTYQDTGLDVEVKGWIRKLAKHTGRYSLVESGLIPQFHPDTAAKLLEKEVVHAYLEEISHGEGYDANATLTMETLFLRSIVDQQAKIPKIKQMKLIDGKPQEVESLLSRKVLMSLSAKQLMELFKESNPEADLIYLSYLDHDGKPGNSSSADYWFIKKSVEANFELTKTGRMSATTSSKVRHFVRSLYLDPSYREGYPDLIVPPILGEEIQSMDMVEYPAHVQSVKPVMKYDHHTDTKSVKTDKLEYVKKLDKKLTLLEESFVSDLTDSSAVILRVSDSEPAVDVLIEISEGDDEASVTYHTSAASSEPHHIKRKSKKKDSSETPVVEGIHDSEPQSGLSGSPAMTPRCQRNPDLDLGIGNLLVDDKDDVDHQEPD